MSNVGTSDFFGIKFENMSKSYYHNVTKFDLSKTHPPQIESTKLGCHAITKWITPWPEISFEKINFPKYEGVYEYLGEPSNKPDYIKDYHVISLARNIDYWAEPEFKASLKCTVKKQVTSN